MTIKKTDTGWLVDVQPGGRGAKRYRKILKTQAEAKAYVAWVTTQVAQNPEWIQDKRDKRHLVDLIEIWYAHRGSGLRSGAGTYRRLLAMAAAMGNPTAEKFSANMFAEYRTKRLEAGLTANNMNREHAYLRAVFSELIHLKQWKSENPLSELRAFKIQEKELSYLTYEQITALLAELAEARNPHVLLVSKTCLATGARWGEAETLRISQVRNGQIQYAKTKSGKVRAVPIAEELESALRSHYKEHGSGERIFGYAASAFREAIERAGISLPDGQMTHVLRHTFASYFMMNGGNILTLQKVLGHSDLRVTMRCAHLAPDHLLEAKSLNPLARLPKAA